MSKNTLSDLNTHLFAQLARLADSGLTGEAMTAEIARANAIVDVADSIVRNAELQVKAVHLIANHGAAYASMLPVQAAPALSAKPIASSPSADAPAPANREPKPKLIMAAGMKRGGGL